MKLITEKTEGPMFLLLIEIGNHSNLCKIQLKYCNTTFQEQQSLQHVMINQMNKCKIIATLSKYTISRISVRCPEVAYFYAKVAIRIAVYRCRRC